MGIMGCRPHDLPVYSQVLSDAVMKRLAGNGMHVAVIATVWSVVLCSLVRVKK
jgi:hypothetical protein